MRLVAIACARNEADIIEAFVRHTLAYCQQLIVMDHGSADETPDILRSLQSEGLPLHVITDSTLGLLQTAHMNRLLKMAVNEFEADWVICLDADEFIQGELTEALVQVDFSSGPYCLKAPLRNYIVHPGDDAGIVNPVERIRHYDLNAIHTGPDIPWGACKVMVPRALAEKENGFLVKGNHRFLDNGFEVPHQILRDVWLGHFSLRQPCQYASKLVAKTLQKYRRTSTRIAIPYYYERPYRQLRESYSTFVKEFSKERLSWDLREGEEKLAVAPFEYKGAPLQYTPAVLDTDQFIKQVLDLTENLARTVPQEPENNAEIAALASAFFSISSNQKGEGCSVLAQLPSADSGFVSLVFPLQGVGDCDSLILSASTEPCILEIDSISITYSTSDQSTKFFGFDELKSMLEVKDTAAIIDSGSAIRIMISYIPMQIKFHGWRKAGEPMPVEATLKLRCVCQPKELLSILLAPNVISEIAYPKRLYALIHEQQKYIGQMRSQSDEMQGHNRKLQEWNAELERQCEELQRQCQDRQELQKQLKSATKELQKIADRPLKFLLRRWRERLLKRQSPAE